MWTAIEIDEFTIQLHDGREMVLSNASVEYDFDWTDDGDIAWIEVRSFGDGARGQRDGKTRLRATDPIYQQIQRYILADAERTDTRPRPVEWRETTYRAIAGRVA
jgi:hypothetical protein